MIYPINRNSFIIKIYNLKKHLLLYVLLRIILIYLNSISEITITIKGNETQNILSDGIKYIIEEEFSFVYQPDQILINGILQGYTGYIVYNLINNENEIVIKWNNPLENTNVMFYGLSNILKIDFSKFDSSKITQAIGMFYGCSSLTSINFNNFNTLLITDMTAMFYLNINLLSLDLSSFNTKKVIKMNYMFFSCNSLISLSLQNFDTSSVKEMQNMFYGSENLESLNLNNFNTSSVIIMDGMFGNCFSLTSLEINNFDTPLVTNMELMFMNCFLLESLNLKSFNVSLINSMDYMFFNCRSLTSLDLSNFNTKNVETMDCLFSGCESLIELKINNFNTKLITSMNNMFSDCSSLLLLDLSSFDTSSVIDMGGMFSNCKSLISLYLNNFNTELVTNMNEMFSNCRSLISLNLKNFDTKSVINMNDIFFGLNKKTIFCVNENKGQNIISQLDLLGYSYINNCLDICFSNEKKLINEKFICVSDCSNDDTYKMEYQNICYKKCPNGTYLFENNYLCQDFNAYDFFSGDFKINNNNPLIKDTLINILRTEIINGKINTNNIIKGEKIDLLLNEKDIIYQITSSENQNNKEYKNISTIELEECEKILKGIYEIDENMPLVILKIDYFIPGILIPIIDYEIFHPINKSQLDLKYCENKIVNYSIPVSIDEDNIFKYDPNSDYYTDECFSYTTENGTDILLNDRHDEFNNNNLSICENNCTFMGYDNNKKMSLCDCQIKSKQINISEIIYDTNILSHNFTNQDLTTNMISMKCYSTLFSKDGLLNNIGFYILIIFTIIFMASIILFYKCGNYYIDEMIRQILDLKKGKKPKKKKDNCISENIYKKPKKKRKIVKDGKFSTKKSKKLETNINNNNKYSSKVILKNSQNLSNPNPIKNNNDIQFNNSENIKIVNIYKNNKISKQSAIQYNDFELNTFSYMQAIQFDKRSFFEYYLSLLKTKHPIVFSFFPIKDYNLLIIKIDIFLLLFTFIYGINALFFNEYLIHKIFEEKGTYNFGYLIPQIIYSFIMSYSLYIVIRYFSLSERHIIKIKHEEIYIKANEKAENVKRCLIIQYICFYICGSVFLIFFWYYLSSFGAVFQNTQFYLIKNVLICSGFCFLFPFIINLLPAALRIISLKSKNKKWLYKFSTFIQII